MQLAQEKIMARRNMPGEDTSGDERDRQGLKCRDLCYGGYRIT